VQERAVRTRARVLDAAAEEFSRYGYTDARLAAVVARVGMTKGALYGHFPSKAALAAALVREMDGAVVRLDGPGGAGAGECGGQSPLAVLHSLLLGLAKALREDVRLQAVYRLLAEDAPVGDLGRQLFGGIVGRVVALVARAQEAGELAAHRSPETVAQVLLAVLLGAHAAARLPGGAGFALRLERAWELLLDALAEGSPGG